MFYKFTKVVIAFLIIPTLVFGIFCTVVLSNTRTNGGIPSIFGYYAVQIPNNNFYNSELGLFKAGEHQMFQSINGSDYKVGDMISYYNVNEPLENHIIIEDVEWYDNLSQLQNPSDLQTFEKSFNSKTTSPNLSINNLEHNNISEYAENPNNEIGLGKIQKIGVGRDINDNSFIICLVSESPQDFVGKPILALNIIGYSINSSPFFIDLLLFSSTTLSFVVMLLLPCILLIIFQVTNLSLVAKQVREEKIAKKRLIRETELKNQQEEFSTAKPLPASSETDFADSKKDFADSKKLFAGLLKGGGGRVSSAGSMQKHKARIYNKEELENIRKGLLSNKKPEFSFDSEFEEDEYFDELKKVSEKKQQLDETEKPLEKTFSTANLSDNEIPEDIIETYGLNIKDKKDSILQEAKRVHSKQSASTVSQDFKASTLTNDSQVSFGKVQPETRQSSPLKTDFKKADLNVRKTEKQDFELPKSSEFGNYFGAQKTTDFNQKPTDFNQKSTDFNQKTTDFSQTIQQNPKIQPISPEIKKPEMKSDDIKSNEAKSEEIEGPQNLDSDLFAKFGFKNASDLKNPDSDN